MGPNKPILTVILLVALFLQGSNGEEEASVLDSPLQEEKNVLQPQPPCTVCRNGSFVSLPDVVPIKDGILAGQTCSNLNVLVGTLFPDASTTECRAIRGFGSLCGCDVPEDSCSLCPNGETVRRPEKDLSFLSVGGDFGGLVGMSLTCGLLEAYLKSNELTNQTNVLCSVSQTFMSDYCGCGLETTETTTHQEEDPTPPPCSLCSNGESIASNDKPLGLDDLPFETCGELQNAASILLAKDSEQCTSLQQGFGTFCGCPLPDNTAAAPCSLCRDGSPITLPNKTLKFPKEDFGGLEPTCEIFASAIMSFDAHSDACGHAQLAGSLCGCPPVEDHCVFCPRLEEEDREAFRDRFVDFRGVRDMIGYPFTCGEAWDLEYQIPAGGGLCFLGRRQSHACGCGGGSYGYFDAYTHERRVALSWAPRFTAFFSVLGSILIIRDILSSPSKYSRVYHRLLLGMSFIDILVSIAIAFTTAPFPTVAYFGDIGNTASCRAQGFFVQLTVAGMCYNLCLSIYYVLVIVFGWQERRIRKYQWWMHGFSLVTGISFAAAGIPDYGPAGFVCYHHMYPKWSSMVIFVAVPISFVVFSSTVLILWVYIHVWRQSRKSSRWRFPGAAATQPPPRSGRSLGSSGGTASTFGSGRGIASIRQSRNNRNTGGGGNNNLQQQVLWQAILYLFAYYLTWSMHLVTLVKIYLDYYRPEQAITSDVYWVHVLTAALLPLQGFWNSLIYFRPRVVRHWKKQRRQQRARAANRQEEAAATAANQTTERQWWGKLFPCLLSSNWYRIRCFCSRQQQQQQQQQKRMDPRTEDESSRYNTSHGGSSSSRGRTFHDSGTETTDREKSSVGRCSNTTGTVGGSGSQSLPIAEEGGSPRNGDVDVVSEDPAYTVDDVVDHDWDCLEVNGYGSSST